jgi:hypothetical protein
VRRRVDWGGRGRDDRVGAAWHWQGRNGASGVKRRGRVRGAGWRSWWGLTSSAADVAGRWARPAIFGPFDVSTRTRAARWTWTAST